MSEKPKNLYEVERAVDELPGIEGKKPLLTKVREQILYQAKHRGGTELLALMLKESLDEYRRLKELTDQREQVRRRG